MTVTERSIGDVTILDVEGRMTVEAARAAHLADEARGLIQRGRKQIVLNLERVKQIDSSGLCDIVTAYTTTMRQGGALKLLHLPVRVRDLLTITKLLATIEAYETEADAIASFGSGPSA
jgi:anti-sigma B factor antagonist